MWSYATVKKILHNEVYKGTTLMNYTGTRSYKDKTRTDKPESEWIRHEASHEAIVTVEEWDAVQKINAETSCRFIGRREPTAKLFSGKLVCADCKTSMTANTDSQQRKNGQVKRYISYSCGRYIRTGRSICSCHTIYEKSLSRIVLEEIKAHAQAVTLDEAAL